MIDNSLLIAIILGLLGLCLGSFVNAFVWRLHEGRDVVRERSECTSCHHILAWYDLIPVISWLWLRGKCRYCRAKIAWQYPLVELATAVVFVVSYVQWPFGSDPASLVMLGLWLLMVVGLMTLIVYDARWYLLPDVVVLPLAAIGLVFGLIHYSALMQLGFAQVGLELLYGMLSVGGIYGLLYAVSRGRWVGFGDVKLGVVMGLVLGWQLGLLSIFIANLVGLIMIIPSLLTKRLSTRSHIPFGPFLIVGLIVALLWGEQLIRLYIRTFIDPMMVL